MIDSRESSSISFQQVLQKKKKKANPKANQPTKKTLLTML